MLRARFHRVQNLNVVASRAGVLARGGLICAVVASGGSLAGCASDAPVVQAVDVQPAAWVEPLQLATVDIQVKRGEDIGSLEGGTLCLPNEDLIYGKDRATVYPDELNDVFHREMEAARYTVVSDPVATVERTEDWKAERMIVPKVFRLQANVCYPDSGVGKWMSKGAAAVAVEWQIHSRAGGGPIYTLMTEGYAELKNSQLEGDRKVFQEAFGAAVRNMLNDRLFARQITGAAPAPTVDTPANFIPVSGLAVSQQPITERLAKVTANIVQVVAGENNRGTGFFIDKGRHVLTTARAAGRTPQVVVELIDGTEVPGTVLMANGRRNVALIATEPVEVGGLPLMISMPAVGAPVFAPGVAQPGRSPAEPAVGVITAIREDDGIRFIQSTIASAPGIGGGPLLDAHGNVIGIATPTPKRGPESEDDEDQVLDVSFFLPVKDALDGLGILMQRRKLPPPVMPETREANLIQPLDLNTAKGPGGRPVPRPVADTPDDVDMLHDVDVSDDADTPHYQEPLPKPEPPLPGIWRSNRNNVWGYQGFGGDGDGVTMLTKVSLKMVERRANWGLFSYHTPRGPGQKWIRLADVRRDAFHWSDTIQLPEGM